MAEVKHTPGPWVPEPTVDEWGLSVIASDYSNAISNPSRGQVCHISVVAGASGDDGERAKANARLIAAAPDLFEAGTELQAARKAQKLAPSAENLSRVRAASDAFDTALSKATAQQEGR